MRPSTIASRQRSARTSESPEVAEYPSLKTRYHRHHRIETLGQDGGRRHLVGDARLLDLALCAHQPLRHGRHRDEECACDLVGREPAQGAQRERDLRIERERRMAAGEDQAQALVGDGRVGRAVVRFRARLGDPSELAADLLEAPSAAQRIDGLVARRRDQPCTRIARRPLAGPLLERHRERVLDGLLGDVEVADQPDDDRQHAAELGAVEALDLCAIHRVAETRLAEPPTASEVGRGRPRHRSTLRRSYARARFLGPDPSRQLHRAVTFQSNGNAADRHPRSTPAPAAVKRVGCGSNESRASRRACTRARHRAPKEAAGPAAWRGSG